MDVVLAKNIDSCDNCPLYQNDCPGNWTTGSTGVPIEPPCSFWNDDDEIYENMYSSQSERDYSEQELKWEKERQERKEKERIKEREKAAYEEAKRIVYRKTKYGSSPIKETPTVSLGLCSAWWCYNCNQWVYPSSEIWSGGIGEAYCPKCVTILVHSGILERGGN